MWRSRKEISYYNRTINFYIFKEVFDMMYSTITEMRNLIDLMKVDELEKFVDMFDNKILSDEKNWNKAREEMGLVWFYNYKLLVYDYAKNKLEKRVKDMEVKEKKIYVS